jgi:hypothetical protein
VLNRLDALIRDDHGTSAELPLLLESGHYYLTTAGRRIRRALADLWDNDDEATTSLAQRMTKAASNPAAGRSSLSNGH